MWGLRRTGRDPYGYLLGSK